MNLTSWLLSASWLSPFECVCETIITPPLWIAQKNICNNRKKGGQWLYAILGTFNFLGLLHSFFISNSGRAFNAGIIIDTNAKKGSTDNANGLREWATEYCKMSYSLSVWWEKPKNIGSYCELAHAHTSTGLVTFITITVQPGRGKKKRQKRLLSQLQENQSKAGTWVVCAQPPHLSYTLPPRWPQLLSRQ